MNDSKRSKKEMQAAKYAGSATALSDQEGRGGEEDAARALGRTKTAVQAQSVRVKLSSGIMDELMDKAYVSVYDPFRELIANSYDANAYKVRIEIEDEHSCYVDDDGYGISDFNSFLTKGMTEKRESRKGTSESGRLLIGEKGLGFLSVFKIAKEVDV